MNSEKRYPEVDALRGFALFGILWVNVLYFAHSPLALPDAPTWLDELVLWLSYTFGSGRFFILFSFLFGFGVSVMLTRNPDPKRYFRRGWGLMILGALHAVFLFYGDILFLYGVLSFVLWWVKDWTTRSLLRLATVSFAVGVLTQTVVLDPAYLEEVEGLEGAPTGEGFLGGFLEATQERLLWLPVAGVVVLFFNAPVSLAMFLLGYVAARKGVFPETGMKFVSWPVLTPAVVGILVSGGAAAWLLYAPEHSGWIAAALLSVSAPLLSFGMLIGVMQWAKAFPESVVVRLLSNLGRASLTGYILHSVLFGFVFYGWGLGLYGHMGYAELLGVTVLVYVVIILSLAGWRRYFRYGPDEWLLRSFMDGEWKRLRR
ncbi:MAG: DUF418 domain-containing protein [Verrucomicrobiales bacterium]